MKIIFTMDHHECGDKDVNNFTEAKLYPKFINAAIESKIDMHVKAGDIYELLQGKKPRLKKAQQKYHLIEKANAKAKLHMKVVHVVGNHEMSLVKKWNLPTEYIIQADGMRIYITHGHIFDRIWKSKTWSVIGKAATEFWGWIEKLAGVQRAEKTLNWMENLLAGKRKSAANVSNISYYLDKDKIYVQGMIDKCKTNNCSVGVFGHTHREFCCNFMTTEEIKIANGGSLTHNKFHYIFIDTITKEVSLMLYCGEKTLRGTK
jgi:predicted phosphodiesterase